MSGLENDLWIRVPEELSPERTREGATHGERWFYLWRHSSRARRHTTQKRAEDIESLIGPVAGKRLLDVGCAWGYFLLGAARSGAKAFGVDYHEPFLKIARRLADYNGVPVELCFADAHALPFPGGSFDVVVCSEVIEHVTDWEAVVAELARVARPGGTVVISTPNVHGLAQVVKMMLIKLRLLEHRGNESFLPAGRLQRAALRCGLRPVTRRNCILTVPQAPDFLFPFNRLVERAAEAFPPTRSILTTCILTLEKER